VKSVSIAIDGMSCASCVARVESAVKSVPGVTDASVNLATETAVVSLTSTTSIDKIAKALNAAGYPAKQTTTKLSIEGMSCASCVNKVEKLLVETDGVLSANVNLATETADVTYVDSIRLSDLLDTLTNSGYSAKPPLNINHNLRPGDHQSKDLKIRTVIAAVLAIPVFVLEMGSHLFSSLHHFIASSIGIQTSHIIQFILTSFILFGPGLLFFKTGIPRLLKGQPDMNSLVAIGTSAAYGFSVISLFFSTLLPIGTANVYFESAAVIVALILLGRYLEARAKGHTGEAIKRLINLQPDKATVVHGDSMELVRIESIIPDDIVQIKPGERIAVDGIVLTGSSYVNESMLSGEPTPIKKTNGDEVIAGSVNQNGTFQFKATSVGTDTVLSQIVSMVETAQSAKLPIQETVNRVTGIFVPVVLMIAMATLIAWLLLGPDPAFSYALVASVSVLIVACPCAMGLATPTSIMVGTGAAATHGIFFRQGDALQRLQNSTVIAFDKTGTLTNGLPVVTEIETDRNFDSKDVLRLAASVEAASEHPIATALVTHAKDHDLKLNPVEQFNSHTGFGVEGTVGDRHVLIGAHRFMQQQSVAVTLPENKDQTASVFVAVDGALAARIDINDPIKSNAHTVIKSLKNDGLTPVIITGDTENTARKVASALGIDQVVAGVLPGEKLDTIRQFQSDGATVAFVGDGINDAPALAAADTGIALGTGTDVAIEAADVVLMSGNLEGIQRAYRISQKTMRNIRQNLFWAFGYNILLIPVAAGVLYPLAKILLSPILAAAAMALSSVFVVSNALRLRGQTDASLS